MPHGNPGAGALAAQIWPTLWLIVRLAGFVWFFTSGNTSWSRWLMIVGLAIIVFIVNMGLFNGVAEEVWGPIRRHLENLIPLAGPPRGDARAPAAAEAGVNQTRAPQGEPDPAQAAARLLEQRRQANGGWLMTQIRRAEHAMLLFLASLVPGVGERHIAAREAETAAAEAERQRAEEERQRQTDAAAAAEAALENSEAAGTEQAVPATEGGAEGSAHQQTARHQSATTEGTASGSL